MAPFANRLAKIPTALLTAVIAIAGCGTSPAFDASTVVSPAPTPTANPLLAGDAIARAIEYRAKLGLPSDPSWVRQVADMAQAAEGVRRYGFPLTPEEIQVLVQRATDVDEVEDVVDAYGAVHPDEWAGSSHDGRSNAVVARFTGHADEHEAALRATLAPHANLTVIDVRWTLAELQAVRERIFDEWAEGPTWLRERDVAPDGVGVDVIANQVKVWVSTRRTDVDDLLEAHYDAGGKLWVISDGTGVDALPKGSIEGSVVNANGNPVPGVRLELSSSITGAGGTELGYGTGPDGRFLIRDIPALTYIVHVYTEFEYAENEDLITRLLGISNPIEVVGGKTTIVEISIP